MHVVFPFLAVAALVIVVPGQDTALTIRNTLGSGRRAGVATACGRELRPGDLGARDEPRPRRRCSSPRNRSTSRCGRSAPHTSCGSALSCLWRALRRSGSARRPADRLRRAVSTGAAFRQGIISNLGNPKMAVFFTSLLPQFTPSQATLRYPRSRSGSSSACSPSAGSRSTRSWSSRASGVFSRPLARACSMP